jgi:tRNA 2-selenouridine synthase
MGIDVTALMEQPHDFGLIVDARSPREFAVDHVPGAINLPVLNDDEYAEVGTLHRRDPAAAYRLGVAYALVNMARTLRERADLFAQGRPTLVYCFRGGKRSKLWLDTLATCSLKADKLNGGWKAYRRWVNAQLQELPSLRLHVLGGKTGTGKTRLLSALARCGAQVLDLEGLAAHRGSLMGALPAITQPTQKWFDSQLLAELRRFEPGRPIWVEAESKRVGNLQLPDQLLASMRLLRVMPFAYKSGSKTLGTLRVTCPAW